MYKVTNNNIYLTRGDSASMSLAVQDEQEQSYDFSSDKVVLTVKRTCTDRQIILQKEFDAEGKIYFAPEDTEKLDMGDYVFDVELRHTEGSGDEAVTTVSTIITPHTFTLGTEVSW